MPVQPRYIVLDPSEPQDTSSSLRVLRTSDNQAFLGSHIPNTQTRASQPANDATSLAHAVLPTAANPISQLLNHPHLISLVDVTQTSALAGSISERGPHGDLTVWEDMDAGSLAYLLPALSLLPDVADEPSWHVLASPNYQRFSLPESLCWHVLRAVARALLWLHHGVKEMAGVDGQWMRHDDDWQPVLIMDVSPGQVWFQKPRGEEFYGVCKLGGFGRARVTGAPGAKVARAERKDDVIREKQFFWAPVSAESVSLHVC